MLVPDYVPTEDHHLNEAAPGHRFRLYFGGWEPQNGGIKVGKSADALRPAATVPPSSAELLRRARERQIGATRPADLVLDARTSAPFVTGMGIEHPIENGFAFLDPYGLPYLPGSSVKGVVRRAAEELALFDNGGVQKWALDDIWWLFGLEGASAYWRAAPKKETPDARDARKAWQSRYRDAVKALSDDRLAALDPLFEPLGASWSNDRRAKLLSLPEHDDVSKLHSRGSVEFWDVLPNPGSALKVDVMTPHFQDYFQKGKLPTDDQNPNPICFLALPPETRMTFVARWRPAQSAPARLGRDDRWKQLIGAAFEHAFAWLGFGAKTTAGYGRLSLDEKAVQERKLEMERQQREREKQLRAVEEERQKREREARRAALSPEEQKIDEAIEAARRGDESVVSSLFVLFRSAEGQQRLRFAEGLREAYKILRKWEGGLSKKQRAKVDEIQRVLREGGLA